MQKRKAYRNKFFYEAIREGLSNGAAFICLQEADDFYIEFNYWKVLSYGPLKIIVNWSTTKRAEILNGAQVTYKGGKTYFMQVGILMNDGTTLNIVHVHLHHQVAKKIGTAAYSEIFTTMGNWIQSATCPVIVAGDFNQTGTRGLIEESFRKHSDVRLRKLSSDDDPCNILVVMTDSTSIGKMLHTPADLLQSGSHHPILAVVRGGQSQT